METIQRSTRVIAVLALLGALLTLAACVPATEASATWSGTATIGTATNQAGETFGTNIILHFAFTGDITALDVTVTGPDGYVRTETLTRRTPRFFLQETRSREAGPLPSGTYVVVVTGSGGEQTWTLEYDADATVVAPVVAVVSATATSVEVAWDLVDEARAYHVTLFERMADGSGRSIPPSAELVDPVAGRHTFSGLDLRPDGEYWVSLLVYDDPAFNDPTAPPRQVNMSNHSTARFAPTPPD